jgi:hypothetical protein
VSISGIFQAAEDFAVLGFYNAFNYYSHLRLKHLPRTDLSGLTLALDIEYDHALDGAMRLDAARYPSVSWHATAFECGVGGAANTYEVRLLDYATVASGSETPAAVNLDIDGEDNLDGGIDWLHLYFRDTRYTVTSADARVETQLTADVAAGEMSLPVNDVTGFGVARAAIANRRAGCHPAPQWPLLHPQRRQGVGVRGAAGGQCGGRQRHQGHQHHGA